MVVIDSKRRTTAKVCYNKKHLKYGIFLCFCGIIQLAETKHKEMKKVILIILVPFIILGILIYLSLWGLSYPRCSEREKTLEIPEYLKNVTVRFERPMMYVQYSANKYQHPIDKSCTNAGKISKGFIETARGRTEYLKEARVDSYGYKQEIISPEENFKIVKHVDIKCVFLSCAFGGGGEEYLLQNEKGEIWRVFYGYFLNKRTKDEELWNAGYYDLNGQRLGDLVVREVNPAVGGLLLGRW